MAWNNKGARPVPRASPSTGSWNVQQDRHHHRAVEVPSHAEEVPEEQLNGVVKSWNGAKGFGFITCDQVAGDVFFSRNELPPEAREVRGTFLEGRSVSFEAIEEKDGRVKASTVQILATDGQPLAGIIKSYSEQNRYGFVTSSSLGDDVRFQSTDLPPMTPGANLKGKLVTFDVQQLPDGKLRVAKMQFQTSKIAATVTACGAFGGMVASMAMPHMANRQVNRLPATMALPQIGNGQMTGAVKSFSDRNGYGFINTPGQPMDIKFGKGDLIGVDTVTAGTWVTFTPAMVPDGRIQAKQVQTVNTTPKRSASPMTSGGPWNTGLTRPEKVQRQAGAFSSMSAFDDDDDGKGSTGTTLPTGQILSGTVKSYIPSKGFGFITSMEIAGDIYFMRRMLPVEHQSSELKGQAVTFELAYAPDGKLRAQTVTLA